MALAVEPPGANSSTVLFSRIATYRLPLESTARAYCPAVPVEYVALAVVLPGANFSTVLLPTLATNKSPLESKAMA